MIARVGRVEEIAKKKGVTMAQIALAWSLAFPGVTAPIVGTTSLTNLKELIGTCPCPLLSSYRSSQRQVHIY